MSTAPEPPATDAGLPPGHADPAPPAHVDAAGLPQGPAHRAPANHGDAAADDLLLERLRSEIARIDWEILRLVGERVAIARQVGAVKARDGLPILDPRREAAVVRNAAELARDGGLPEDEIRQLFWHLIGLSRRAQQDGSRGGMP